MATIEISNSNRDELKKLCTANKSKYNDMLTLLMDSWKKQTKPKERMIMTWIMMGRRLLNTEPVYQKYKHLFPEFTDPPKGELPFVFVTLKVGDEQNDDGLYNAIIKFYRCLDYSDLGFIINDKNEKRLENDKRKGHNIYTYNTNEFTWSFLPHMMMYYLMNLKIIKSREVLAKK